MRLYSLTDHPLRVYLEEELPGEISKLALSLDNKYAPPENSYTSEEEDELTSILFYDTYLEKYYVVHGLLNIIIKEAISIGILCTNEVTLNEAGCSRA